MLAQKRQSIPITTLKHDFIPFELEKAAAPQPQRIGPLQHAPLAVFEDVFNDANHFGQREFVHKHLMDGSFAHDRVGVYLVVYSVFGVKLGKGIRIGRVEGVDPALE
jgi:hypothetical protein